MIKVRKNVFETNSSSIHSITIEDSTKKKFKYTDIPKNTRIYVDGKEFNIENNNETEWTRLNALVNFVIGYYDDVEDEHKYPITDYINEEEPFFNIIKKIVKDKCNSEIVFKFERDYRYQTDHYIRNSLSILNLREDSTEEEFYDRFKDIIFNPEINFRHQEIED
jgi:hypothetical protein